MTRLVVQIGALGAWLGAVSGCATSIERPLPSAEDRLSYGRMAIEVTSNTRAIEVRGPGGMPTLKESFTPEWEHQPMQWLFTVPLAIGTGVAPAALVGVAYGQLSAGSREAATASASELRCALNRLSFDQLLCERVVIRAKDAGLAQLTPSHTVPVLTRERGSSRAKIEYERAGTDTLLRICVYEPRFESNGWQRAHLEVSLSVRVSRPATGVELFYGTYCFRGQTRSFAEWCASESVLARAEIERCIESFAGRVIGEVFLGVPDAPDRR